jgi:hypothetical protein
MRPTITFTVTPTNDGEYSRVNVVTTITDQHGIDHDVILYDQLRMVKPLKENQSVEWWTLTHLSSNASAVVSALISMINNGSVTLMVDGTERQRH